MDKRLFFGKALEARLAKAGAGSAKRFFFGGSSSSVEERLAEADAGGGGQRWFFGDSVEARMEAAGPAAVKRWFFGDSSSSDDGAAETTARDAADKRFFFGHKSNSGGTGDDVIDSVEVAEGKPAAAAQRWFFGGKSSSVVEADVGDRGTDEDDAAKKADTVERKLFQIITDDNTQLGDTFSQGMWSVRMCYIGCSLK